jgi:hypothetical protein
MQPGETHVNTLWGEDGAYLLLINKALRFLAFIQTNIVIFLETVIKMSFDSLSKASSLTSFCHPSGHKANAG